MSALPPLLGFPEDGEAVAGSEHLRENRWNEWTGFHKVGKLSAVFFSAHHIRSPGEHKQVPQDQVVRGKAEWRRRAAGLCPRLRKCGRKVGFMGPRDCSDAPFSTKRKLSPVVSVVWLRRWLRLRKLVQKPRWWITAAFVKGGPSPVRSPGISPDRPPSRG